MTTLTNLVPTQEGVTETIQKNRTLYVKNLNSKIKLDVLKKELQAIFENFGQVIQIVAMSSFWRRGQAWIVFADQESADKALNQLQGFPYSGKKMVIQYAREKSDIVAKEENTFKPRQPGPRKPRAILEREKKLQQQLQQFQQIMVQHLQSQNNEISAKDSEKSPKPLPLIPPQLAAVMMSQLSIPTQQSKPLEQPISSIQPAESQSNLQYNNFGQHIIQNPRISKDAVVAAATVAAAQAAEAAKKRGEINSNVSRFDSQQFHDDPILPNNFEEPQNVYGNVGTMFPPGGFQQGLTLGYQGVPRMENFQKAPPPPPGYTGGPTPPGFSNGPPIAGFPNMPSNFQKAPPPSFQSSQPMVFQNAPPLGFQSTPVFQGSPAFQNGMTMQNFQTPSVHGMNLPRTQPHPSNFSKITNAPNNFTASTGGMFSGNSAQFCPTSSSSGFSAANNPNPSSVTNPPTSNYAKGFSTNHASKFPSTSINYSNTTGPASKFNNTAGFANVNSTPNGMYMPEQSNRENAYSTPIPPENNTSVESAKSSCVIPNRTLFVEQLPEECDTSVLKVIFKQYPGCGEIRHIPSHRVAFVDYETVAQATTALRYLNNFTIQEGSKILVSYAQL